MGKPELVCYFRFYGELNDFLPPEKRQVTFAYAFNGPVSVKHLIEALGAPHTEVEIILVNGESVTFSYLAQPADRISVYPAFTTIGVSTLVKVRPPLPQPPRFILDNHLGRLAAYLRLLGFDTRYRNDYGDEELARLAYEEERVLLTRDRGLLKRSQVIHGHCLRTRNSRQQLAAVWRRFNLAPAAHPWRRCLRCNGLLEVVAKEAVLERLEPKTRLYYDEFHTCQECKQIYWKGSHYERLQQVIAAVDEGHSW
jgi:uncharacterized protein with PIN domain